MNIEEVVIEFENKNANQTMQHSNAWASDGLQSLAWNPQGKSDHDLFDDGIFGLQVILSKTGSDMLLRVYKIETRPQKPKYVTKTIVHPNGDTETTESPEFTFDKTYFIAENMKQAEIKINLVSTFGRDWKGYLTAISEMRPGSSAQKIEQAEFVRSQKHGALANRLARKLSNSGLENMDSSNRLLRGFISMMVEYHYAYGNPNTQFGLGFNNTPEP